MTRPPRKVESSPTSTSTSTTGSFSSSDHAISDDPQSRRLVDYFVVFSSKPQRNGKKKTKATQESDDEEADDSNAEGTPTTPTRKGLCCGKNKGRGRKTPFLGNKHKNKHNKKKKDTAGSGSSRNNKHDTGSIPSEERLSNRAVHLPDNVPTHEDTTPVLRNRKHLSSTSTSTPPTASSPLSPSSNKKTYDNDLFPTRNDDFRVPVTNGSFVSDNESEIDTDNDETERRVTSSKKKGSKKKERHVQNENEKDDEEEEEEVLTPSRMRAKHLLNDDNDDDNYGKLELEEEQKQNEPQQRNVNSSSTTGTDRGASTNMYLPAGPDEGDSTIFLTPVETARHPAQDHPDNPFNPNISQFCFPQGKKVHFTAEYVMPRIHYFVLTNDRGKKMYGTCLTVYEELDLEANKDLEIDEDDLAPYFPVQDDVFVESADSEDSIEVSLDHKDKCPPLYHPKVLCILSSWPYLHAFREYLSQLYRLATMTNMMSCPIERYILNICEEVPAPPPGMFEIRLEILNSTIRFWAPPAKQPIPYVSIPFNVLFECLDLNNVLFVWYALTLENKVLLVSSQNSLLTLCAEILCALLFPMEWSVLYVPILPPSMSQILDAPFPYLCGISRDNFSDAIGHISEETIVVDLDQNLITKGDNTPRFPPMPLKRRSKLEACLQKNVGDIFWNARGVTKQEVEDFEVLGPASKIRSASGMMKTLRIWKEKLQSYDDAFNLAFTPNSENVLNGETGASGFGDEFVQSKWDCVQEAFLTFFVSMLRDYKRYIGKDGKKPSFREKDFLKAQRPDYKPFLKEFVQTQHFDCFLTRRMYSPHEPDVQFFDQSITAKRNRSKMTLKKRRTHFLMSAKAQKQLRKIDAAQPRNETESTFNLLDRFYSNTSEERLLSYSTWPETLDANLLKNPMKIPDAIAAEFERRSGRRRNQTAVDDDFHVTEVNYSIEVTTFTLYFILCCEIIGKELEIIQGRYMPQGEHLTTENTGTKSNFPDCANMCTLGKSVSKATVNEEYTASYRKQSVDEMKYNQLAGFSDEIRDSEIETARVCAFAELDLAFSALETLFLRNLKPNVDALKSLMAACGRCGSSDRATKLMTMIQDNNIYIDSETYFYFVMNAPLDEFDQNQRRRKLPTASRRNRPGIKSRGLSRRKIKKKNKNKKGKDAYLSGSDNSSYSETGSSLQDSLSMSSSNLDYSRLPPRPSSSMKMRQHLTINPFLKTTAQVETHIGIARTLLNFLYSDLEINLNSATCQSCGEELEEDQVRQGWKCSFTDYTTECPHCRKDFVPTFVVKTSDPNFNGSQGPGTPLHCEFLSPWVLHKDIHAVTQGSGMISILDPKWRNGGDMNSKLWWNLVVTFQRLKLPITFILQGSFRERLIMPMPE